MQNKPLLHLQRSDLLSDQYSFGCDQKPVNFAIIVRCFKATQRLLVGSQIWKRDVKEWLILRYLHIHHVVIQLKHLFLIGAKVAGTVIWNCSPGTTRPKIRGFMSGPGNNPALVTWVVLLGGSQPGPGPSGRFQPGTITTTR